MGKSDFFKGTCGVFGVRFLSAGKPSIENILIQRNLCKSINLLSNEANNQTLLM